MIKRAIIAALLMYSLISQLYSQSWEIVPDDTTISFGLEFESYKGNVFAEFRDISTPNTYALSRAYNLSNDGIWVGTEAINKLIENKSTPRDIAFESLNDTALLVMIGGFDIIEKNGYKLYRNKYYIIHELMDEPQLLVESLSLFKPYSSRLGYHWNKKELYLPMNMSLDPKVDSMYAMMRYYNGKCDTVFVFKDYGFSFVSPMTDGFLMKLPLVKDEYMVDQYRYYSSKDKQIHPLGNTEAIPTGGISYQNGFLASTEDFFAYTSPQIQRRLMYYDPATTPAYWGDPSFVDLRYLMEYKNEVYCGAQKTDPGSEDNFGLFKFVAPGVFTEIPYPDKF
jgi:hypothetical protein